MRTNGQIEIRRCRPILGTFVEIQAFGTNAAELEDAVEAAYLAFANLQRLKCLLDPESEISRMNRYARYKRMRVHP
jgi:thiamine biosynthesis lipoprotein